MTDKVKIQNKYFKLDLSYFNLKLKIQVNDRIIKYKKCVTFNF